MQKKTELRFVGVVDGVHGVNHSQRRLSVEGLCGGTVDVMPQVVMRQAIYCWHRHVSH